MSHPRTQIGFASLTLIGVLLVLVLGIASFCYDLGVRHERDRQQAAQLKQERQAAATFQENLKLGRQAAQRQLEDERAARSFAERLISERRHATLTLPAPACLAPVAHSDLHPPGAAGPGLTADAVRLWNSALAGHDVPAGACGADAAVAGACAADSGLTVDDAWNNQAVNALSCRIDRGRLTELQDYLKRTHP